MTVYSVLALCCVAQRQSSSWAESGFQGSPQATFLVALSSPVGPVVGVHLLAIPDLVATSLEP